MITALQDTLYGRIEHSPAVLRLMQTREMKRLRHVSLSALPPWLITSANFPTRYEHAVGASHLASLVVENNRLKDYRLEIVAAALAHDIGAPPFSHLSEDFMDQFTGKDHEAFAEDVLNNSEFAEVLGELGGDLSTVTRIIRGELAPWSQVVHSSIDVDNLDNILRYAAGMGLVASGQPFPYSPEKMAGGFVLNEKGIHFKSELLPDILGWANCRHLMYNFIGTDTNVLPQQMLNRAIYLAVKTGELDLRFFRMVDREAYDFLEESCNPRTAKLCRLSKNWQFYERAYLMETLTPSPAIAAFLENKNTRNLLADRIASELKLSPEDVCVYSAKSKGYRKITVPILNEDGTRIPPLTSSMREYWTLRAYLPGDHMTHQAALGAILNAALKESDPAWQNEPLTY